MRWPRPGLPGISPALAAGAVAVLLLVPWVHPTVMFADDGELVRAIWETGLAHPPGSPLYLALSEPFTLLPFGSIAFRAHLAGAAAAGFAVWAAFALASAWGSGTAGALVASSTLLFAPIFWQQSRLARPYPLQAALTVVLLLILARLVEDRAGDRRLLPLLAFVAALSPGAHQLLVVPAAVCLAIGTALLGVRRVPVAPGLPFLALGGLIWLHLPLRTVADTISGWVRTTTADEMLFHLAHRQFAGKLTPGSEEAVRLLGTVGASLPKELAAGALAAAALGAVVALRRRPLVAGAVAAVIAGTLFLRVSYVGVGETEIDSYRVIVRYLLGLYAILAVAAGIGWGLLTGWVRRSMPAIGGALSVCILTAAVVLLPLGRALRSSAGYPSWTWHDRNRAVLVSAGPKALVVANNDDIIFPLWYLQDLGGYAPDSFVFGEAGLLMPWARRELASRAGAVLGLDGEALARSDSTVALLGRIPVESGVRVASTANPPGVEWRQHPRLVGSTGAWGVRGTAFLRLAPAEQTPSPDRWRVIPFREPTIQRPSECVVPVDEMAWFATVAARRAAESNDHAGRLALLHRAVRLDPYSWAVHNDLGLAYAATGQRDLAVAALREAVRLAPFERTIADNLAILEGM